VLQALGQRDIPRVRVGIGRARQESGLIKHVLRPFSSKQFEAMRGAVDRAADAVEMMVRSGVTAAMNEFNARPSAGKAEEQESKA
jgi:PTH1 family peptidyl-tRNA hydrolase